MLQPTNLRLVDFLNALSCKMKCGSSTLGLISFTYLRMDKMVSFNLKDILRIMKTNSGLQLYRKHNSGAETWCLCVDLTV
jgi:hypothetical protein